MIDKPSITFLKELSLNKEDLFEKLLLNMKKEIIVFYENYYETKVKDEKISIVHKSVMLFSMLGMNVSAERAKKYEINLRNNSEIGKIEFEESLIIAYTFLL